MKPVIQDLRSVVPLRTSETERIANLSQQDDNAVFRQRKIDPRDQDLGSREILIDEMELIWYPAEVNTSIRPGWFYHEEDDIEFLKKYDVNMFEKLSVTVDMLIFTVVSVEEDNYRKLPEKALKLLMVKRGDHPFMGQWALPGGFVSMQESIEDAALRELKTETNVYNVYMEQLYTWGDDAEDAKWFNIRYNITQEKKTITEKGYIAEKYWHLP